MVVAAALAVLVSTSIAGQAPRTGESHLRFELRADYLDSPGMIHAGAGAAVRLSNYLRVGAVIGAGPHLQRPTEAIGWRAEVVGRFHVDPFREKRWAPYGAAGLGVRGAGGDVRELLLVAVGVEGPLIGAWAPALEVGLGRGIRLGAAFRRGGNRWR